MSYPRLLTILWTMVLIIAASFALAEVPQIINYQGCLTDVAGDPVADGPYQINFKIYGSESGDDSLWWSGFQSVQVTDGCTSSEPFGHFRLKNKRYISFSQAI